MGRGVRKPQPSQVPPSALGEGPQYGWSSDLREPPVTRSNALHWILVGFFLTVMLAAVATFIVSLWAAITDPGARTPVLTALISSVTTLFGSCLVLWRIQEKTGRAFPGRNPHRKKGSR